MADRNRRSGCGCLGLALLLLVPLVLFGSALSAFRAWADSVAVGVGLLAAAGLMTMVGVVTGLIMWSRRNREGDPAVSGPVASSRRGSERRPTAPERSEREVRSGPRRLTTQPESEEAQALKQRLTEAVADLADNVEEMPNRTDRGPARRMTSDEMIARAKRRIREKADDPDF